VYRFWGAEGLFAELLRILEKVGVPVRILVAFFAKLKVYRFWGAEVCPSEFWSHFLPN
jgi:hypothetical protein